MTDFAIRAEGLGKKFLIGHQAEKERYTALRDVVVRSARGLVRSAADMLRGRQIVAGDELEEFWALKDVSFEIKRGDVVGIIGRNGAGKSTLLKILSRISEPSEGRVVIRGRVASLLEVGTGFHPELSGRENIFLNGAILGMMRAEIRRKFDEIVEFAGVERFLDTPVKRYSSGMYVRLAFAVAAHLEPEILVVDEVLAVGDAEFQKKCLGKMQDVAGHGRTVLFVSHNLGAIASLCRKGILLEDGALALFAPTERALLRYNQATAPATTFVTRNMRHGPVWVERVDVTTREDPAKGVCVDCRVHVRAEKQIRVGIDLRFKDGMGVPIGFSSLGALDPSEMLQLVSGENEIAIATTLGDIASGAYSLSVDISQPNIEYYQRLEDCLSIHVSRDLGRGGRKPHEQAWGLGSLHFPSSVGALGGGTRNVSS